MPLNIIRQSIIEVEADAIVNTANLYPAVGGGTDTAVYEAAGSEQLMEARLKIGDIEEGCAAATPAFNLPYKIIIHTVSPIWQDGKHGETELLRSCYLRSLKIAEENECESVAFPLLASGSNGFPKDIALKTALDAIQSYLMDHEMQVILAVFDKTSFELSSNVYADVRSYIHQHQVDALEEREYRRRGGVIASGIAGTYYRRRREPAAQGEDFREEKRARARRRKDFAPSVHALYIPKKEEYEKDEDTTAAAAYADTADYAEAEDVPEAYALRPSMQAIDADDVKFSDIVRSAAREETFQVQLLKLIDASGRTDPEVYKRANIDRKLFAKIRKDENYKPSRKTAIALAIALKLDLAQTQDLLQRAGYSISLTTTSDLIIRYCLEHGIWNINDVNSILFRFDQETL